MERFTNPYDIPDAFAIGLNVDIVYGAGVDMTLLGKLFVLKGEDAGTSYLIEDVGFAGGYDIGVNVPFSKYYYTGDISTLTAKDFTGLRFSVSVGFSAFIEGGMGVSVAPVAHGGYIIGISPHIGVSPPGVSGNFNTGFTGFK